jgi:hypothetical protein
LVLEVAEHALEQDLDGERESAGIADALILEFAKPVEIEVGTFKTGAASEQLQLLRAAIGGLKV